MSTTEKWAKPGTCATCGEDLVQTNERTYHPAVTLMEVRQRGDTVCPDLLPINCGCRHDDGKRCLSCDVPDDRFVPELTQ